MTFTICFKLTDGTQTLVIDTIDNPVVNSWVDHFRGTKGYFCNLQNFLHTFEWNPVIVEEHLNTCKEKIKTLKDDFNIVYDGAMPGSIDHINRFWTNSLHRFFTHQQRFVNLNGSIPPGQRAEINKHLQAINSTVHEIENYLPPSNPVSANDITELHIESFGLSYRSTQWFSFEENRHYHTDQYYDVILTSEILGKTLLRSYLDNDNPNDWDTSGHYSSLGGLQIQLEPKRQQLYQSENFTQWLNMHNVTTPYYDFPIGNVRDRTQLIEIIKLLNQREDKNLTEVYYL